MILVTRRESPIAKTSSHLVIVAPKPPSNGRIGEIKKIVNSYLEASFIHFTIEIVLDDDEGREL